MVLDDSVKRLRHYVMSITHRAVMNVNEPETHDVALALHVVFDDHVMCPGHHRMDPGIT